MKEEDQRNNNYWVSLTTSWHEQITVFYEACYDSSDNPKDANTLDPEQQSALIAIMAQIQEAIDSAGKKITIEDVEELPYKK